jgi:Tfp pilus assembly protein PilV
MGLRLPSVRREAGFTMVEVIVAAVVLVIGVLGTVALVGVASQQTVGANGLQGATNVARRVLEVAQSLPARNLTQSTAPAQIQAAAPDLATSATDGTWVVTRGGLSYTITTTVCYVDDPSDQMIPVAQRDSTFCPGQPTPTSAQVTPPDPQPQDYKRLTATVTWNAGSGRRSLTQSTIVSTRGNADLPQVSTLAMTSPSSCSSSCPQVTSTPTGGSIGFNAATTNYPSSFTWLIEGNPQQTCPPTVTSGGNSCTQQSLNSFNFTWGIGTPTTAVDPVTGATKCTAGGYVYDGTYNIGGRALDSSGNGGQDVSLPVTLNRCAPIAVPNLAITNRDGNGNFTNPVIDLEWSANPEGDVVGYRVYRGTSLGAATLVCSSVPGDTPLATGLMPAPGYLPSLPTTCTDSNAPSYAKNSAFYYGVVAVDRDSSGNLREGMWQFANVNGGNTKPGVPAGFAITVTSGAATLTWTKPADTDLQGFRIYRRPAGASGTPTSPTQRYDRDTVSALCGTGSSCTWTDAASDRAGLTYVYNVTAVDTGLWESGFTANKAG